MQSGGPLRALVRDWKDFAPAARLGFVDGKVVNPDGGVSPIVHQHDRHPHLAEPLHDLWGRDMRYCERSQPRTAADRGRKWKRSLMRRLPELR